MKTIIRVLFFIFLEYQLITDIRLRRRLLLNYDHKILQKPWLSLMIKPKIT